MKWYRRKRPNVVLDVAEMPNRDPNVKNGLHSVSEGKVRWGRLRYASMDTVCCRRHGAMLRVGEKLWRCPTCNEGAYTPNGVIHKQPPQADLSGLLHTLAFMESVTLWAIRAEAPLRTRALPQSRESAKGEQS